MKHWKIYILPGMLWAMALVGALAQSVSTTTVQGTVYAANGTPGAGTLQLSWPAFTTAANQAIAAGRLTVTIGADGFLSVNLAPNQGAMPAGLYYTAVYHLSDGTTSTEYWTVPAAAQTTIAQVRAQVMPAAQAVQAVSKSYVDQSVQELTQSLLTASGGNLSGPLYLATDPTVSNQAATKHYVDSAFGNTLPTTGGTLSGPLLLAGDPTASNQASTKHYVDSAFSNALPSAGGAATGPLTATQLGAVYQADQESGADFGGKLQSCINALNGTYGGTCDARNFTGALSMSSPLSIATANVTVQLPCATITTANPILIAAGTRNVTLHGCASRGTSTASGTQGGTVFLYSGAGGLFQVGDRTYTSDTLGFHLDNVAINTTASSAASTQAISAWRTQELNLASLYLLGNANQNGITLDGTGNYTGGTFQDIQIGGYQIAVNGIGHQVANAATTDWLNASTFTRLHIDCPTTNGSPTAGTYGINLQAGDGNTFTGGDVESCATALHLGSNAQNNTIVGLRNENSTQQVVADPGSAYNNWMTGGTMFTGQLVDNGTRNSFLDTFHRSFNGINGDWYGSQQDATLTNHLRLGTGAGNERGLLNRYQTDYGYRWTEGFSDATAGAQYYQLLDELNNVYRLSIGQYNNGQASTNNQTVLNSAGTGAIVLNGSNNAGTGGVVFGSGGASSTTVGTIDKAGNAQFNGTLQVSGTAQSAGTMTVRNNADAEVDYYLWPGLTSSQKGSFTYKDYNGNSQWYMVKDTSNNWALNSATGGIDSFKAYQSGNSGDTYVNAQKSAGVVRVNYESGSGTAFNVYGGNSSTLYASFSGSTSIKLPGLASSSGTNCVQIDNSGYLSNSGTPCNSGANGVVSSGILGQIAYYTANGNAIAGMSTIPVTSGGTGASNAVAALATLGGASLVSTAAQVFAGPVTVPLVQASVNSQINVMAPPYNAKGDCVTDDNAAITAALRAADAYAVTNSFPATVLFPKPPGGCYLTSPLTWYGEPLLGQGVAMGPAVPGKGGVVIQGKPGMDILNPPDPSVTANFSFYPFSIQHITFRVDDTVASTRTNRWPGRFADDITMTAGSTLITSKNAIFSCGDVGQAITVAGAGASGATLTTTIASVQPCWPSANNNQLAVNLATPASTSVTNAHTYISVGGLPVTQPVGACAIAFDNVDPKAADWPTPNAKITINNSQMFDVEFVSVSGAAENNACAFFQQGAWMNYGLDVRNFFIARLEYGVVQGVSPTNAFYGSSGDYQKWDHGNFNLDVFPWISYSGEFNRLTDIQLATANGPQILQFNNSAFDVASSWHISNSGDEAFPSVGPVGWRIEGNGHIVDGVVLAGGAQPAYFEASQSNCNNCVFVGATGGGIYIGGYANTLFFAQGGAANPGLVDYGRANIIQWSWTNANPFDSMAPDQWQFAVPMKNLGYSGYQNADFLVRGDVSTPWTNNDDLFFWPRDVIYNVAGYGTNYANTVVQDASTLSGWSFTLPVGQSIQGYSQFETAANPNGGTATIGTYIPATRHVAYFSAKCPSGTTSMVLRIGVNSSAYQQTYTCGTSYQTYSTVIDLTAQSGQTFAIANNGTSPVTFGWWALRPFQADYNGSQPLLSASALGTTAGDTYCASSTSGQVQDCGPGSGVNPQAPTPATGDNSTKVATTAYVQSALSGAGSNTSVPQWLQYLGEGADGAFSCTSGTCNLNGGESHYSSFSIASGATVTNTTSTAINPMVIRVTGACTIAGTLAMSANDGTLGGVAGGNAYWSGTGGGGGGGTAAGSASGTNTFLPAAAGGAASGGTGTAGGTALSSVLNQRLFYASGPLYEGTGSGSSILFYGGSGGGNGGSSGGAGGKGGGAIILVCGSLSFTGTIDVSGQAGASPAANNQGAGGGGAGGFVLVRSPNVTTNTGTINTNGGAGGTCGSYTGCGAGGSGSAGWSKIFTN